MLSGEEAALPLWTIYYLLHGEQLSMVFSIFHWGEGWVTKESLASSGEC